MNSQRDIGTAIPSVCPFVANAPLYCATTAKHAVIVILSQTVFRHYSFVRTRCLLNLTMTG